MFLARHEAWLGFWFLSRAWVFTYIIWSVNIMPELRCMKTMAGRLPPETPVIIVLDDSKWWWRLELFVEFLWDFRVPRNYEHHKKFFALCKIVLTNTDDLFANMEHLREWITIKGGWVHLRKGDDPENPKTIAIAKSINFSSMDQAEFDKYYNDMINVILQHIMIGMDKNDLEREIASF